MDSTMPAADMDRIRGREVVAGAEHLALVDCELDLMRRFLPEYGPDAN
jgi:hypothetical protein